ncbi:stalk domain-containing protein [Neobacillus mesonae]|nr:stalk domain-containing protein [Neobacillus mesonae]
MSYKRIKICIKSTLISFLVSMTIFTMTDVLHATKYSSQNQKLLSDVTAIAAGEWAVYAVKKDGSVWVWGGMRNSGLIGNGLTVPSESPIQMKIDGVIEVASGSKHALILKQDGTVWATGSNVDGQLGLDIASDETVLEPVQIEGLSDIIAIAAEGNQSLALQADGTVWQWGRTDRVNTPSFKPIKIEGLPLGMSIATGYGSSMMLDTEGNVHVWGTMLYETNPDKLRKPTIISGLMESTEIVTLGQRAAALTEDGTLWTWNNSKMYPTPGKLLSPTKVLRADGVQKVAGGSGSSFSLIKNDGTVWMWDSYWDKPTYTAVQVPGINNAVDIANSQFRGQYALLENGTVIKWTVDPLGMPSEPEPVKAPIKVQLNDETLSLVVPPIIINNISYVPLRGIFEHIGATIKWDQGSFTSVIKKDNIVIEIHAPSEEIQVNGKSLPNELKPKIINDVTMVPVRFISEILGANVKWMSDNNTINIRIPEKRINSELDS